jgi:hypothetical protein
VLLVSVSIFCGLAQNLKADDLFSKYTDFKLSSPYIEILKDNLFLMDVGGAVIITHSSGTNLVMSIGCAEMREPTTPKEKMRRRNVARIRAISEFAKSTHPVKIYSCESFSNQFVTKSNEGEETEQFSSEYSEKIRTEVSGHLQGLPIVGSWISKEDGLFYIAIGGFIYNKNSME